MILSGWRDIVSSSYRADGVTNGLRCGILGAAVFALAIAVPATGDADHPASYSLRHAYKVGETARYKLDLRLFPAAGSDSISTATMVVNESVRRINRDGSPVIARHMQDVTINIHGSRRHLNNLDTPPIVAGSIAPKSQRTSRISDNDAGVKYLIWTLADIGRSLSPPGPVHVGDTWRRDIASNPSPISKAEISLNTYQKYQGIHTVTLEIAGDGTAPTASGRLTEYLGRAKFNAATSRLLSLWLTGTVVVHGKTEGIEFNLSLLPDRADPFTIDPEATEDQIAKKNGVDKANALSLVPTFVTGKTDRFSVTIGILLDSVPNRTLTINMILANTVDKVDKDGVPAISEKLEDISGVLDDKQLDFTGDSKIDPNSRATPNGPAPPNERYDADKTSGYMQIASNFLSMSRSISPGTPVTVGDAWTNYFQKSTDLFSHAGTTFTGIETNQGSQIALLDLIGDINDNDSAVGIKGQYRGSMQLDAKSGRLLTLTMKGPMKVRSLMGTMRVDIRNLQNTGQTAPAPVSK